jgi:tetratricopeptide (TPR) repeat protein
LADLDGEDTLGDVLESKLFEEQLLYGLWVAGRLELHAAPTLTLTIELAGVGDAPAAEQAGDDAASPTAEGQKDPVASIRELSQRVMGGDDFEVLDIPLFATDRQVEAAHQRILEQISDASLADAEPDVRERVKRIRKRAAAAYQHLKDSETRRAYALLRQEEDEDRDAKPSAERALEAERWFRKGERFLKRKRYDEAAEAFGMASHLDPDEGDYLSHLGYSLYLSRPKESVVQREAMEHIANGIKRSPARELSYVYLGRILVAKGDTETARKVLRRALRIKPDCHPALQELRLLELRERKGKGLLSRFLRR